MKSGREFAVCIFADENALLTPRKLYQVLPDDSAARSNYVRVIDDEGEDYVYPKKYFVFVAVSKDVEAAILQVA